MSLYAEVGFQRKVGDKDLLTYKASDDISVGSFIKVPLKTQKTYGIVVKTTKTPPSYKTREIGEVIDKNLLSKWQVDLMIWISEYYMCPLHKVIKLFVPSKIFNDKKMRALKAQKESEKNIKKEKIKTLTDEQIKALEKIEKSNEKLFLLHGITGSGKTEIYTQLAQKYTAENKQVLILVPEISLTPQTVEYFEKTTGEKAETIHSRLSEGERIRAWQNIKSGKSKIVIGSRSAIFAPFQSLGLIIVDEEHEPSYKQDQAPRYDARKVALKLAELIPDLQVIFGSATPSCEAFSNKKFTHLELKHRIDKTPLPKVEIADMREEFKKKNFSIFSDTLHKKIEQALANKEQIILFLNRRGNASAVVCRACGYRVKCKNCDVSLTYHKKMEPILICHHCGKTQPPPINCPMCGSHYIKYIGTGTQKVEEETIKAFPKAKVLRADKDTTGKKHSFEKIYKDFRAHKANILIGTQMIGKGLHLPKVNLVGVILADIGLGIPDFRSQERTFQLLEQVAGRAGRGKKQGEVVIQTYEPKNPAIKAVEDHSYNEFCEQELRNRQSLAYPPFSLLTKLTYSDKSEKKCIEEVKKLEEKLGNCEKTSYPALIPRLNGKYRYHILVKNKRLNKADVPEGWKIDVDPISIN